VGFWQHFGNFTASACARIILAMVERLSRGFFLGLLCDTIKSQRQAFADVAKHFLIGGGYVAA
jgi:hypothetical protein